MKTRTLNFLIGIALALAALDLNLLLLIGADVRPGEEGFASTFALGLVLCGVLVGYAASIIQLICEPLTVDREVAAHRAAFSGPRPTPELLESIAKR